MKREAHEMSLLLDFYGDLLTERQREFVDLYYNEDLSLAEIAENSSITRQGVRDVIVRAERTLTELEDKTQIIARFLQFQPHILAIEASAQEIMEINHRSMDDDKITAASQRILRAAQALKE